MSSSKKNTEEVHKHSENSDSISVAKILETDAKYRMEGVKDDIFTLDKLKTKDDWTFDSPTLARSKSSSEYKSQKYITDISSFKKKFYGKYRFLQGVDLTNLLIAGGSVRSILLSGSESCDLDIFVYKIAKPSVAVERIEKFIQDIYFTLTRIKNKSYMKEKLEQQQSNKNLSKADRTELEKKLSNDKTIYDKFLDLKMIAMYNGSTITLMVDDKKVQIILRLYNTKSEIIHGFDLGSSAVGFDGTNVIFTSLGKFCYENMVNIFDGTRRSTTYEYRLIKYFDYGFAIVLPNFNIKKLRTDYHKYHLSEVCEMPHIVFSYSNIDGNVIAIDKFFYKNSGQAVVSDYDFFDEYTYKLPMYNMGELLSGNKRFISIIEIHKRLGYTDSENDEDISEESVEDKSESGSESESESESESKSNGSGSEEPEPSPSKKPTPKSKSKPKPKPEEVVYQNILEFNEAVIRYGYVEWFYNSLMTKLLKKTIDISMVLKYINVVDAKKFINDVYLSELASDKKSELIKTVINKQKEKVKKELNEINTTYRIKWITKNPTTQLTSSINPIIEDPKKWYGDYYRK